MLLVLKLIFVTCSVIATQDYVYEEYDSDYGDEEHSVKDNTVDFSSYSSKILSKAQTIEVAAGATIRFPCKVDDLPLDLRQNLLWKRLDKKNTIISAGKNIVHPDYRTRAEVELDNKGGLLKLILAQKEDAGEYQCSINMGKKTVEVTHRLKIKGEPSGSGNLALSEGDDMILTCNSSGSTRVSWTWEGGKLPSGEDEFVGEELRINSVKRNQGGTYHCKAGSSVEKEVMVVVEYRPEVSVKEVVLSSLTGGVAELMCTVRGVPRPLVQWSRAGLEVHQDKRISISRQEEKNILTIEDLSETDLDEYTCTATNRLGSDQTSIQLTTGEVASNSKSHISPARLTVLFTCIQVVWNKN